MAVEPLLAPSTAYSMLPWGQCVVLQYHWRSNLAVGYQSLYSNTTSSSNIAIGNQLFTPTVGYYNSAVGTRRFIPTLPVPEYGQWLPGLYLILQG